MSEQTAEYIAEQPELVVIRGMPSTGKSTLARNRFPGHMLWEPDAFVTDGHGRYRFDLQYWPDAQVWCLRMADHSLARGESCVVADVLPTWEDVEPYYRLADAHGARLRVVTIRGSGAPGRHRVPVSILDKMERLFEYFDGEEAETILFQHELIAAFRADGYRADEFS